MEKTNNFLCAIPFPAKVTELNIVKIKGHNFRGVHPSPIFMKLVARKCIILSCLFIKLNTVDSRYLEIEGTLKTLRDIRTSTYQICSIEEKIF